MVSTPVVILIVVGALFFVPPLLRVRITRLRLGSFVLQLTRPLDFGSVLPALASLAVGVACLVVAASAAGVLPSLPSSTVVAPPTVVLPDLDATPEPPPTATPLRPEEFHFVEVDEDTRIVTIKLLQTDTMAGWTAPEAATDFDLSVSADAMPGPINSVACVLFRAAGEEIRPGESYRASGSGSWPHTGYMYCVSHVGLWSLARFDNGRPSYLREYQESRTIRQIKANKLRVRAEGSTIQIWLNDMEMARVTDPSYTSGTIQLTCGTPVDELPAAECHFEGLEIKPLP